MSALADILAEQDAPPPIAAKERPAVEEVVVPSGAVIRYEDKRHFYWINDVKVPSVSAITGVIDKSGPLKWWGMKIGVQGVQTLMRDGHLAVEIADTVPIDVIVALLTKHKITVNHVLEKASDRGTTVHDALEAWALDGTLPDPADYSAEQEGYVRGLLAFLADATIEPTSTEMIVGSATHSFAGRYDLEANVQECELVTHLDEKKEIETRSVVPGGHYVIDLKTTGSTYIEVAVQLAGYELGRVECGYPKADGLAAVRVSADGRYEFVRCNATDADFLGILAAHHALSGQKDWLR